MQFARFSCGMCDVFSSCSFVPITKVSFFESRQSVIVVRKNEHASSPPRNGVGRPMMWPSQRYDVTEVSFVDGVAALREKAKGLWPTNFNLVCTANTFFRKYVYSQ